MKMQERHEFILNRLKESPYIDVSYLTKALNVSEMTIRRDLDKLEKQNFLFRVYGGARRIPVHKVEASLDIRLLENAEEKESIAKYAAGLVQDGDVISMDASSTVNFMVKHLQDRKITVITNNMSVAMGFSKSETVEVILLGGRLKKQSLYLYGYNALDMMKKYNTDKAFFSSTALSIEHGLTDVHSHEGENKKAMISSADEHYLLVDSSKFETRSYYNVSSFYNLDHIITNKSNDKEKTDEIYKVCEENNINLHVCE